MSDKNTFSVIVNFAASQFEYVSWSNEIGTFQ